MNAPLTPPAEDIARYAAAIEWAVHVDRERILREVHALGLETTDAAGSTVSLEDVVRVIG